MRSPSTSSPSSPAGCSSEMGSRAFRRISQSRSGVIRRPDSLDSAAATSTIVGSRPSSCARSRETLMKLEELIAGADREPDRAGLIGDRSRDRLADPPVGVGRELIAARVVELLDRADEPDVSLLDEVDEAECRSATRHVRLGSGDNKAQIGRDEPLTGRLPSSDELARRVDACCASRRGRVAHLSQQHGVSAGLDPTPESGDGQLVAGPRLERTNDGSAPLVFFGDLRRSAHEVKKREGAGGPGGCARRRCGPTTLRAARISEPAIGCETSARLADERPVTCRSAGADRPDVGRRGKRALARGRLQGGTDDAVGLDLEGQPVGRVRGAGISLGRTPRPLPEREDSPLRLSDDLSTQHDRLGEHDLLLGREEAQLADRSEIRVKRVAEGVAIGWDELGRPAAGVLDRAGPRPPRRRRDAINRFDPTGLQAARAGDAIGRPSFGGCMCHGTHSACSVIPSNSVGFTLFHFPRNFSTGPPPRLRWGAFGHDQAAPRPFWGWWASGAVRGGGGAPPPPSPPPRKGARFLRGARGPRRPRPRSAPGAAEPGADAPDRSSARR